MPTLNPDEIRILADHHYTDEKGFETPDEKLFGLLVNVAWAYELELRKMQGDPTAARPALAGSLAVIQGMTPRDMLLAGLKENLEMEEENHKWD